MANPQGACAHCGQPAREKCMGCHDAGYCSRECRVADLELHESLCSSVKDFQERPTPSHRRAILLPEDARPRFVWLPTNHSFTGREASGDAHQSDEEEDGVDEDDSEEEFDDDMGIPTFDPRTGPVFAPEFTSFIGEDTKQFATLVAGKMGGGQLLDHCIKAVFRESFLYDGSRPNRCLHSLTGGKTGGSWRGPILIFGTPKVEDSKSAADLRSGDLTLAIRGFVEYHQKMAEGLTFFLKPKPRSSFEGVVISIEEVNGFHKAVFTEVKVPVAHPICGKGREPSWISVAFGANLLTYTYPGPSDAADETQISAVISPAAFLHLVIEVASKDFGHISESRKDGNKDVLVINSKGKPLRAYEVEAACKYIETIVSPAFQQIGTTDISDTMGEKAWQKFLASFEKEHLAGAEGIHEKLKDARLTASGVEPDEDEG